MTTLQLDRGSSQQADCSDSLVGDGNAQNPGGSTSFHVWMGGNTTGFGHTNQMLILPLAHLIICISEPGPKHSLLVLVHPNHHDKHQPSPALFLHSRQTETGKCNPLSLCAHVRTEGDKVDSSGRCGGELTWCMSCTQARALGV